MPAVSAPAVVAFEDGNGEPLRVGWLVPAVHYNQASVRYRCAHPVTNLMLRGVTSSVFTEVGKLLEVIKELDVVIAVKRLDADVIQLAARCADLSKQFYIDLCDDIVSADRPSLFRQMPQAVLRAVAPLTDAFICPTPVMQSRLYGYLQDNGLANVAVTIIPDCIETDDVYRLSEAAWSRTLGGDPPQRPQDVAVQPGPVAADPAPIQLCWFGNWGGEHSDFGLTSLLPVIGLLNKYENRHEVSLHLVSNNQPLGEFIKSRADFSITYHEWSREIVSTLLARTHFALVTSGDDQFSAIKSPNRTLLALASGVPVILDANAESSGSLWHDGTAMPVTSDIVAILERTREEGYAPVRDRMLAVVRPSMDRYRLERIASQYLDLFQRNSPVARPRLAHNVKRLAHVFAADEDLMLALRIRRWCEASGVEFMAVVSFNALQARRSLFDFLVDNAIKPSLIFEAEAAHAETRRLRGAQIVVMSSKTDKGLGARVRTWSATLGVALMTQGEFLYRFDSAALASPVASGATA